MNFERVKSKFRTILSGEEEWLSIEMFPGNYHLSIKKDSVCPCIVHIVKEDKSLTNHV